MEDTDKHIEELRFDLQTHPIVFFDGVCGVCNKSVDLLIRADKNMVLRFSPLQGKTAQALLPQQPENPDEWTMIFLDEHGAHCESDCWLELCRRLGGSWSFLYAAKIIPRIIRNVVYRLIARHRYWMMGKRDSCRIPTPEEIPRFYA